MFLAQYFLCHFVMILIGVLKSHCSGSKCQISGGQKDPYFQLKYFNQVRVVRSLMNNNP